MQVIEGNALARLVDYSFGDHHSAIDPKNLPEAHFEPANASNTEFLEKCKEFEGRVMTLFIDNIRLYNRSILVNAGPDALWVTYLLNNNDLLALCATLSNNLFRIFTSHEDTPIDDQIKVPSNVEIWAVNALFNNDRIHPFPIGLQRPIGKNDDRLEVIKEFLNIDWPPSKLLYINCGLGKERNYEERAYLPTFEQYDWATCRFEKNSKFYPHERYLEFLHEIKQHKFMVCPKGHGADCHRNWETLYMRRIPIFKDDPYFRLLMKDFPCLFVKEWSDITPELLAENDYLFDEVQKMDMNKLDLNYIYAQLCS